jgi:hypothetical protein
VSSLLELKFCPVHGDTLPENDNEKHRCRAAVAILCKLRQCDTSKQAQVHQQAQSVAFSQANDWPENKAASVDQYYS